MPTVTVKRSVTLREAAEALHGELGDQYQITTHGTGAQQALKIKQSAASTATVRLEQNDGATTFHVHGGGLVISRMVNELGIARRVTAAITGAFATHPST